MKLPCEVYTSKFLPAIRKIIVDYLYFHRGYTYKQISSLLGISEVSISQYLKNKRGDKKIINILQNDKELSYEIKSLASALPSLSSNETTQKFCNLCKKIIEKGYIEKV